MLRDFRVPHCHSDFGAANVTPCPSATAPAGNPAEVAAQPPAGTHPDAGAAALHTLFPEICGCPFALFRTF